MLRKQEEEEKARDEQKVETLPAQVFAEAQDEVNEFKHLKINDKLK